MSEHTKDVLDEVFSERERQDQKWGGSAHDDEHRPQDWYEMIDPRLERASFMDYADTDQARQLLIEAAAMIVAQIESMDRR